jgi:hypothetical protein
VTAGSRLVTACAAIALTAALAACSTPPPGAQPGQTGPTATPAPGRVTAPAPGLQRPASGPAIAYGWVVHLDLEGGFWALVDRPPAPSVAEQPKVVVVLLPGVVPEPDIARLEGGYARATGTVSAGVSARMAGPEMKVDAISGAQDRVPK